MKISPLPILLMLLFFGVFINGCSPSEVNSTPPTMSIPATSERISISLDKRTIFHIGVSNPISIIACDIPSEDLNLSISKGTIIPNGNYKYNVTVSEPGSTNITVSAKNIEPTTFSFEAKPLRDPIAKLSKKRGGLMSSGEFRAQGGVSVTLNCYDFDAKCKVDGFDVGRIPKGETLIEAANKGGRYEGEVAKLIAQASSGDVYFLHKIKVRCPGDIVAREINSLVFKIR